MNTKPTIFIGIGTSGLYVLEQLQNFCYENLGVNKPPGVEYLYIETNKDNQPALTAAKNEITRVYVSLSEMKTMVKELRERPEVTTSWLPPEEQVLDAGLGAGGIPSCGRLALWGHNSEGNNLLNVISSIQNAHSAVSNHAVPNSDNDQPTVFITGSLTGGTGTGMFIDIAFLVRHIIHDVKELFGLTLLPPKPLSYQGNEIIYCNTFGALRAIKYYNDPKNAFKVHLPNSYTLNFQHPPFEMLQSISQSYNTKVADISSLTGLYRIAGLYLFLNMIGLRAKRMERLVDAKGNVQIGKHSTFGLSAIQYPKSQIKEFLALEFSSELLSKWIDAKNYYQGGQQTPINRSLISNRIKQVFSEYLRNALDTLNAAAGRNIMDEIKQEAIKVNKGSHSDSSENYVYKLFSSSQVGNWYDTVRNNLPLAQDSMISSIHNFVVNEVNNVENLYYVRQVLESFADTIEETLRYWKSLGVTSMASDWENMLANKQIPFMLKKRFGFLMEQDNVLQDRMIGTLDLMKFHLFGKMLDGMRQNIKSGDMPFITATRQERQALPVVRKIDDFIRDVQIVLGNVEDNKFKSLGKRKLEIEADMQDITVPILRIYPSGDFSTETKQSMARYKQMTGETMPKKENLIGGQSLWSYLSESEGKLVQKLYHDCVLKFGERLDSVSCVHDYDVSQYVERNPQEAVKIAGRSKFFMLPIREKILENNRNIPRVVLGADKEVIGKVIRSLQSENFLEFAPNPDHILEIKELKNIMVFYIEQGNFEPADDITYMDDVKQLNENYPKQKGGNVEKNWDNFRNPYLNQNAPTTKAKK